MELRELGGELGGGSFLTFVLEPPVLIWLIWEVPDLGVA